MEILSETPSLKLTPGTNKSSEHIHLNMTWVKEDNHDNSYVLSSSIENLILCGLSKYRLYLPWFMLFKLGQEFFHKELI